MPLTMDDMKKIIGEFVLMIHERDAEIRRLTPTPPEPAPVEPAEPPAPHKKAKA